MPAGTAPALSDCTTALSLLTYYLLVVLSMTGLSTLLGMTDFVDRREIHETDQAVVVKGKGAKGTKEEDEITLSPLLQSARDPSVSVSADALQYVARRSNVGNLSDFRIIRRFEYDFRMAGGLNVIMIHVTTPAKSIGEPQPLHLIEVYRFRNPILRCIARIMASSFGLIWPSIDMLLAALGLGNNSPSCPGHEKKAA